MALDLSILEQSLLYKTKFRLEEVNTDLIDCMEQIRSKNNPGFSIESLTELGNSFVRDGQSEPAIIRPNPNNKNRYIMIAGERRYRACKLMGLKLLCIIRDDLCEDQIQRIQRNENNQRVNLTQLEVAASLLKDKERLGSLENVANEWHKSVNWVSERLKYLSVININGIASKAVKGGITSDITAINDLHKLEQLSFEEAEKLFHLISEQPDLNIRHLVRDKLKEVKHSHCAQVIPSDKNRVILRQAEKLSNHLSILLSEVEGNLSNNSNKFKIKHLRKAVDDLNAFILSLK